MDDNADNCLAKDADTKVDAFRNGAVVGTLKWRQMARNFCNVILIGNCDNFTSVSMNIYELYLLVTNCVPFAAILICLQHHFETRLLRQLKYFDQTRNLFTLALSLLQ